ncbi:3'(2'),5'-bisphosphate nucleotidase CysQ [Mesorhizobium xinjiangense]|uniref:3'(2'),5'-bisphosphate nucleotidase CysQ n=1 Tax=Mesorhizobium xinjiangense TaxID=2678685 RepID=UPI0012EE051A|nr:3'(2'),5'-bisphosphate nucleotidase CysQ [Mesorhizobium xinjiangense]
MPAIDTNVDRLDSDLALIREAAEEAGHIALRYFGNSPEVWLKDGSSPVSEADIAIDRFLCESLTAARPDYGWLSEETADSPERLSARRVFVVDPIDGTRAFIDGRDSWCVSIAVVEAGRAIAGVLECPARKEHFHAQAGRGAFLDGKEIAVRKAGWHPVIGGPKAMIEAVPANLRARLQTTGYIPSLAYRVATIARGEIDGTFVKPNAHDWDLAAADLILHEAGGGILDASLERPDYGGRNVRHGALVAGSGPLLDELAQTLAT